MSGPQHKEKKDEDPSLVMIVTPVLLGFLAYVALRVGAFAVKPKFSWEKTKYVYAFGDSYTFVQGTKGRANFRYIRFYTTRISFLTRAVIF